VVNALHQFLEKYPERRVFIHPIDNRRKLLYNRIIKENLEEILLFFFIEGVDLIELKMKKYEASERYDAFVLSKKKSIFEFK
jgi:hypothetical protein